MMKFNFVSKPNQTFVKKDDYGEEINIFDHFDTDNSDDFIAGYFKEVDFEKGVISIVGELTADQIETLLKEEPYVSGEVPNIYDVKQRIDSLNYIWDIDWEIDELRDEDGDLM
jgi:hypothetical protein